MLRFYILFWNMPVSLHELWNTLNWCLILGNLIGLLFVLIFKVRNTLFLLLNSRDVLLRMEWEWHSSTLARFEGHCHNVPIAWLENWAGRYTFFVFSLQDESNELSSHPISVCPTPVLFCACTWQGTEWSWVQIQCVRDVWLAPFHTAATGHLKN